MALEGVQYSTSTAAGRFDRFPAGPGAARVGGRSRQLGAGAGRSTRDQSGGPAGQRASARERPRDPRARGHDFRVAAGPPTLFAAFAPFRPRSRLASVRALFASALVGRSRLARRSTRLRIARRVPPGAIWLPPPFSAVMELSIDAKNALVRTGDALGPSARLCPRSRPHAGNRGGPARSRPHALPRIPPPPLPPVLPGVPQTRVMAMDAQPAGPSTPRPLAKATSVSSLRLRSPEPTRLGGAPSAAAEREEPSTPKGCGISLRVPDAPRAPHLRARAVLDEFDEDEFDPPSTATSSVDGEWGLSPSPAALLPFAAGASAAGWNSPLVDAADVAAYFRCDGPLY